MPAVSFERTRAFARAQPWCSATCSGSATPKPLPSAAAPNIAANNLLKRARITITGHLPPGGRDQAPLPGSPREQQVTGRFANAFERILRAGASLTGRGLSLRAMITDSAEGQLVFLRGQPASPADLTGTPFTRAAALLPYALSTSTTTGVVPDQLG